MIDEKKYEGHAEGEWTIEQNDTGDECAINAQDYGTIAQTFYRDSDKLFYATSRLIADAPLLLAEVKRLQKYSNVLENLMGLLDSSDEGDWILLETIDELMKEEGIARWSQEKDKTETNLI